MTSGALSASDSHHQVSCGSGSRPPVGCLLGSLVQGWSLRACPAAVSCKLQRAWPGLHTCSRLREDAGQGPLCVLPAAAHRLPRASCLPIPHSAPGCPGTRRAGRGEHCCTPRPDVGVCDSPTTLRRFLPQTDRCPPARPRGPAAPAAPPPCRPPAAPAPAAAAGGRAHGPGPPRQGTPSPCAAPRRRRPRRGCGAAAAAAAAAAGPHGAAPPVGGGSIAQTGFSDQVLSLSLSL